MMKHRLWLVCAAILTQAACGAFILRSGGAHGALRTAQPRTGAEVSAQNHQDDRHDHTTHPHGVLLQLAQLCSTKATRLRTIFGHPVSAVIYGNVAPDDTLPVLVAEPVVVTGASAYWLQLLLLNFFLLAYVLFVCVVAFFYYRQKPVKEALLPEAEEMVGLDDWKYGLCECCSEPSICLWACCCPAIRWADTLGMTGLISFWLAFSIYVGIDFVGGFAGEALFWMLLAIICAGYRQELRIKFGMRRRGGLTYVEDCLLYCCCWLCVMTQEARQVEEACKMSSVGEAVAVPSVPVQQTT